MSEAQRLIRGCEVVTPAGTRRADILMQGEWVVAVAPGLSAVDVIPADGLLALPGAIDAHVHMREPGAEHKEDFTSGTRAALAGGVTTILDMPNSPEATTSTTAWQAKLALAERKSCCDFGLFIGATPANAVEAASIDGAAGLKVYMGSSTGDLLVSDLEAQLEQFATYPSDRVLAVHAEDEEAVRLFGPGERRPPLCAELAVARAIALARRTRRRLHVCHVSTAAELDMIALAKRQGLQVSAEVAPHHLFLSQDDERRLGPLGVMNPPLRSQADVEALWRGLAAVDMVASDHAPHTLAEKQASKPPSGVPGVETMLPLMLDAALRGRLSLERVATLLASGPAAAFPLVCKGIIAPGYHADIVLVDPSAATVVGERLHTRCGWSPYAGLELRGRIERVLLRGRDAVLAGEVLAEPGWGSPAYHVARR